ncbi:DUF1304 domain-containing protein [Prevotella dentasini]
MQTLIQILATLSALEHLYIMLLETVLTTSATTARVFSISADELRQPAVRTLFRNQGVYNGLLAVLLLLAVWIPGNRLWMQLLLGYIVLVAIYGSITSHPLIVVKQGGIALVALLLSLI